MNCDWPLVVFTGTDGLVGEPSQVKIAEVMEGAARLDAAGLYTVDDNVTG